VLNCPETICRTETFYHDESLFLQFTSPIDGYLSVFLDDGQNTWRLLPYSSMAEDKTFQNYVMIKADKPYIFFDKNGEDYFPGFTTDGFLIIKETPKTIEYNDLIILFSANEFYKPILNESFTDEKGWIFPKSIESRIFEKWLADCRATVNDFQDIKVRIGITDKK
jgi:hypothetical protein